MSLYPGSMGPHASLDDAVYRIEKEYGATISKLSAAIPDPPSANGTYLLQCVKSNSGAAYSWVSAASLTAASEPAAGT